MKRAFRTVLGIMTAGVAVVALAACGGTSASSGGTGSGKQLTIGFVPGIASDPFFRRCRSAPRRRPRTLGIKLLWQGSPSEYSPQSQIPFVDTMLTQRVDGLCSSRPTRMRLQPSVTKAQGLKIPVVTVDTTVTDQSSLTAAVTGQ